MQSNRQLNFSRAR